MGFVARWLITALALYLTTLIVPGIHAPDAGTLLVAGLVLGVVNAIIRPVVLVLTLPLSLVTLGLFALVVNALMLYLVAAVTPLEISTFWAGVVGALLISIFSAVLSRLF